MCNQCQQTNCGCPPPIFPSPCNICPPSCPPEPCACPVKISTDCSTYFGDDLPCTGIVKGTILTELIQQLDAYICAAIEQLYNSLNLINIGLGAKIYKGVDGIGRREIRSITGSTYVDVVENANDINISLDETAILDLQNNFVRNITITTDELPNNYTVQDICDYILTFPVIDRTIAPTDSKWNVIIIPGGN